MTLKIAYGEQTYETDGPILDFFAAEAKARGLSVPQLVFMKCVGGETNIITGDVIPAPTEAEVAGKAPGT